jgi:hypothetical protein
MVDPPRAAVNGDYMLLFASIAVVIEAGGTARLASVRCSKTMPLQNGPFWKTVDAGGQLNRMVDLLLTD